jgi:hypothetical protein
VKFLENGGVFASGIVTTTEDFIDIESVDSLTEKWLKQMDQLKAIGIEEKTVYAQTLITPSCGTGAISREHATKVLALVQGVSAKIRELI